MTPLPPDHSISPESSDGFASVGTILPKEKAALLPGGLFIPQTDSFVLTQSAASGDLEWPRIFDQDQIYCSCYHCC